MALRLIVSTMFYVAAAAGHPWRKQPANRRRRDEHTKIRAVEVLDGNNSEWCKEAQQKAAAIHEQAQAKKAMMMRKKPRHSRTLTSSSKHYRPHAVNYSEFLHSNNAAYTQRVHLEKVMQCEGDTHWLSKEEVKYAMCPPGHYLTHTTVEAREQMSARLRKAMCTVKRRGAEEFVNHRETSVYKMRGYSTFESAIWPKADGCQSIIDEKWYYETGLQNRMPPFKPDMVPTHMGKLVTTRFGPAPVEFHKAWKVASTAFPDYLQCEYEGAWHEVPVTSPVEQGSKVVFAVREPIGRWVSAVGELLERAINHYCPNGPCSEADGFDPAQTPKLLNHLTSWYRLVKWDKGYVSDQLPEVVSRMVKDTQCNYHYYASEHFTTQSTYAAQSDLTRAANLSLVMKLEHLDVGLGQLSQVLRQTSQTKCEFVPQNSKVCKPGHLNLPDADEIKKVLVANEELMRTLCLVYAQDFVCFDYDLPEVCKGLF